MPWLLPVNVRGRVLRNWSTKALAMPAGASNSALERVLQSRGNTGSPAGPLLVPVRAVHPSVRLAEFRAVAAALCGATDLTFTTPVFDEVKR